MHTFKAVIERDTATGLFVGHVPGFPGAHSQGASVEELKSNLREVIELLLDEGASHPGDLVVITFSRDHGKPPEETRAESRASRPMPED